MQILSVFDIQNNIIIAQQEIDKKTNEIPTAQKLIRELAITNCIFTFDAMNCQQKTIEAAVETGSDIIVQVKHNQKKLYNDCENTFKAAQAKDEFQEPFNKERNRIESRKATVYGTEYISDIKKWEHIETVIRVDRYTERYNTKKKLWEDGGEYSYYVSTAKRTAEEFAAAIRNHWGIENVKQEMYTNALDFHNVMHYVGIEL